jgi:hypothetical protein
MAITVLCSSGERFRRRVRACRCCAVCGYTLGVEFVGFHNRAALVRRGRDSMLLPVPARLRKGEGNSGFPPPIRAFRRLQRVGLEILTWGSGVEEFGTGEGDGYGGWTLGDGIRGLALGSFMVDGWAAAVDGPACEAVGTLPCRRRLYSEGNCDGVERLIVVVDL